MPRKKPFSGKQKKLQLQEKRIKKQDGPRYLAEDKDDGVEDDLTGCGSHSSEVGAQGAGRATHELEIQKINLQPTARERTRLDVNSFRLHFFKESEEMIAKKKREARKPVKPVGEKQLEYKLQDAYPPGAKLDFPKRPPWRYSQTKEQLDQQEREYFSTYVSNILDQPRVQDLSYFELNLETWRQLWRVLEISDILLIVADVRYPVLHVPPSLVFHVLQELHKQVVIILNKVDFVPVLLALSWKHYLQSVFPGIHVVFFSSCPRESHPEDNPVNFDPSAMLYKKPFNNKFLPVGPAQLLHVVKGIVGSSVDLSSWERKLNESASTQLEDISQSDDKEEKIGTETGQSEASLLHDFATSGKQTVQEISDQPVYTKYKDGVVTMGCIGYPNVGKSSLLNALVGRKVVSVSKTPGHTKHFQTIFLSASVRLCDCPGLVFPSMIPKSLQVLAGLYPVAQVNEPYSVIGYLAKRLDLPKLLHLTHPSLSNRKEKEAKPLDWSAYDICEAWAVKSGFTTSKAGRPDLYRAANKILRLAVEGQLCLCYRPPDYSETSECLMSDPEIQELSHWMSCGSHHRHMSAMQSQEKEEGDSVGSQSEGEREEEDEEYERQREILDKLEDSDSGDSHDPT